ncbi:hypothetical protein [Streptomyces sp. NPDC020917]|uniref:hypothetical protein n=1 Tax=Streptomyces sp. NPDC020917 TaxID=3365102 RepID=UPI0037947455
MGEWARVTTAAELMEAIRRQAPAIEVSGVLQGMPMVTLPPGTHLRGGTLQFGARGVRLTRDNVLEDVAVRTAEHEVAVLNDTSVDTLGTLELRGVRTRGQVLLLARDAVRSGHVRVAGLTIEAADVRGRLDRPHDFGVDALQGAFTLWNQQPDPAVEITAELLDVAAGSAERPVRGSGVFVGGHGDRDGAADGGTVRVGELRTGEIHTDGGIPAGTPDLISDGVFVVSGAVVEDVRTAGPVTTRGQNDMVLDNWGRVRTWTATAPVVSHGPSGIGFVNFGALDHLDVQAPITTHGTGARGFNLYDGSLRHASFDSITTSGDGAVGVQVSRHLPRLEVRGDLATTGGTGTSLVRGVQVELQAVAFSIKPGGRIDEMSVGGRIATRGDGVTTVEIDGELSSLAVAGGITAEGRGSDAVHIGLDCPDLAGVAITAADGRPTVRRPLP